MRTDSIDEVTWFEGESIKIGGHTTLILCGVSLVLLAVARRSRADFLRFAGSLRWSLCHSC